MIQAILFGHRPNVYIRIAMKKAALKINGLYREAVADPDRRLIDFLRDDLELTGTKQSCDRAGQCGICTVYAPARTECPGVLPKTNS